MKANRSSIVAGLLLLLTLPALSAEFNRTEDVIYGRKFGTALTMDVFQPVKTNGFGIAMMVSGGWFSAHEAINTKFFAPLLDRGYTVFAVVHGSQPKFTVPEIEQDIHRAIRYIRSNAGRFGIAPDKIGITGGSAGGHLSLTMVVKGAPGNPSAKDPVDRASSEVQCAACFFPPTDFLNYSAEGDNAVGVGTLKNFKAAFGPQADSPEGREKLGREISPVYFIKSNQAPALIIHGDADTLVPMRQAEVFVQKAREKGNIAKLEVRAGKVHGWADMDKDVAIFAAWFDEHLRGIKAER